MIRKGARFARYVNYSIKMPVRRFVTNKEAIVKARGGHTQQYIADALGVSRSTVQNWEYGKTRVPAMAMIAIDHLKPTEQKPGKRVTKKHRKQFENALTEIIALMEQQSQP